jgi:hypothetical protein
MEFVQTKWDCNGELHGIVLDYELHHDIYCVVYGGRISVASKTDEIESITRELMALYHSRGPGQYSDGFMFKSLTRAYEDVLCNKLSRQVYNLKRMGYLAHKAGGVQS